MDQGYSEAGLSASRIRLGKPGIATMMVMTPGLRFDWCIITLKVPGRLGGLVG